jgi:hypothetical protein
MVKARNYSHTLRKKSKEDICLVCGEDLYYKADISQRIGLIDSHNEITGWICPFCDTEFGNQDEIVYIYGRNSVKGNT